MNTPTLRQSTCRGTQCAFMNSIYIGISRRLMLVVAREEKKRVQIRFDIHVFTAFASLPAGLHNRAILSRDIAAGGRTQRFKRAGDLHHGARGNWIVAGAKKDAHKSHARDAVSLY